MALMHARRRVRHWFLEIWHRIYTAGHETGGVVENYELFTTLTAESSSLLHVANYK